MDRSSPRPLHRFLELWIRVLARLVQQERREAWAEEWRGESWYAYAAVPDASRRRVPRLALAALCDALFVRSRGRSFRPHHLRPGDSMMQTLLQDLRYGLRTLAKVPILTAVVVLTLGLGVGAATAIFSVVDALLLNPLPYDDAERLVILWQREPSSGVDEDWFSVPQFVDLRDQNEVFETMAMTTGGAVPMLGRGAAEELGYVRATSSYLEMLGAVPLLGRSLGAEDDAADAEMVALLTHGLWQRRFGGDPGAVGDAIQLGRTKIGIVGVLPPDFLLDNEVMPTVGAAGHVDVVLSLPLTAERLESRGSENYNVVARLRPEISLERARADVGVIAERMREAYPDRYGKDREIVVTPLLDEVVGGARTALVVLLGAVGALLLIACGNVANLLLSRGAVRRREMGVRLAVGAGRGRLVRQLLTEALLLAAAGGVLGLALARAGVSLLHRMGEAVDLPRLAEIAVDGRVLAFTLAVTVTTCLVFGILPAYRASRVDPAEALQGGRGTVGGASWTRLNLSSGLVVVEIALSLVLLIGGGLLARSFAALTEVDPGFTAEDALTFKVVLSGERYAEDAARAGFFRELLADVRSQPGVVAAGAVSLLPFGKGVAWGSIGIEGYVPADPDESFVTDFRFATPGYFEALGIPLVHGRSFTAEDDAAHPAVVLVDARFAERIWPGQDPVGKRVEAWSEDGWATVAGVVGSVQHYALDGGSRPVLYYPHEQVVGGALYLTVRAAVAPAALAESMTHLVHGHESEAVVTEVAPMTDRVAGSLAQRRFSMLLLQAFSAVALVLAAVGLYGVVAYRVSRGVQDLGVRMALGATPGDVLRLVLRHGMAMTVLGLGVGLAGAVATTRLLRSLLFGVGATDAPTYATLSLVLVSVTLFACWIPARRASRVDPLEGLREQT